MLTVQEPKRSEVGELLVSASARMEHVEQAQGFAAFTYNVVDGRPSCVRTSKATTSARRGLAPSDGNKRACPDRQPGPRKRAARAAAPAAAERAEGAKPVTAGRGQPTPKSFERARRGAAAFGAAGRRSGEPIDLTCTSSCGSEDAAAVPSAAKVQQKLVGAERELRMRRHELDDTRNQLKEKKAQTKELLAEVQKLSNGLQSLEGRRAGLEAELTRVKAAADERTSVLEARLLDAAAMHGEGSLDVHSFVERLHERLSSAVKLELPTGARSAGELADQLAASVGNVIAEQRGLAAAATREAAEERRAREQADAALVRAGQAAAVEAEAKLNSQLASLQEDKARQVWGLQQQMAAMKEEHERRLAEQRGEINALERQV